MFTDKLQNPFLKPSPFTNSTANYTPSYSSSSNFPPRYGSYNPYEEPKISISSTSNQYSNYEQHYNAHAPRTFQSKDIDTILTNNPFNRDFKPSFGYSRANRELSPSQVTNFNYDRPSSNYNYEGYSSNNRNYESTSSRPSTITNRYSDATARLTPTKKYDNYLSSSSADSATTYINKIYELDDQKPSVNQISKPLSNPFFRKNLLQKVQTEPQLLSRDYDSAALKYMGYKIEEKRQEYHFDNDPEPHQNSYKPQRNQHHLNRGATFGGSGNDEPIGSYKDNYSNNYDYYDKKYQKNYDSKPSLDRDINVQDMYKDTFQSKYPKAREQKIYEYKRSSQDQNRKSFPSEVDKYEPRFGSNYDISNYAQNYSKNIQSNQSIPRKEDNDYMNYNKKMYQPNHYSIQKEPYQYNFDQEYERPSQKNIFGSKKNVKLREDDNRVRFDSESQTDSKYQNHKEYEDKFETLGGNSYSSKPQEPIRPRDYYEHNGKNYEEGNNSFGQLPKEPTKFSSSQVDEYSNPQDVEKKIKEAKYRKLGYEPQSKKENAKEQMEGQEQNQDDRYAKPKMPTRDSNDYPKVLQVAGVLFHKIQIM